jgi:hypothetical protein
MLAFRRPASMIDASDRFRGTIQRWTIDAGPLAGTAYDHAFNTDWSLTWRVVAGSEQDRVGRARQFSVQAVRSQLFLVSFPLPDGELLTATVDFASKRFVGFLTGPDDACTPLAGSIRVL